MDLKESKSLGLDKGRHPWELARWDVVRTLLSRYVVAGEGRSLRFLDIGCGDLFIAQRLVQFFPGAQVLAVDSGFDQQQIEQYRQKHQDGAITLFSSLDDVAQNSQDAVDVVLLLDVLEHIDGDQAFLADLRERPWVGDQTLFLITVPAGPNLFCSHDRFLGHCRRYTQAMLRDCAQGARLSVIAQASFFMSLLMFRWLEVAWERMRGVKERDSNRLSAFHPQPWRDKGIKAVLNADFGLSFWLYQRGIRLPGLSNFVICRK